MDFETIKLPVLITAADYHEFSDVEVVLKKLNRSLPSCHERAVQRDNVNRKLENASGGFVGRPGDKVKVNVEVVRSVYSQQYGVYFVSGVTTNDQAVFFSHRNGIQPGKLIVAEGTVKAHRDNSTQLNRVKVI